MAHTEACDLFSLLDVSPSLIIRPNGIRLPSISAWYSDNNEKDGMQCFEATGMGLDNDEWRDFDDSENDKESSADALERLFEEESKRDGPFRRYAAEKALKNISFAAASLTLDDQVAM